MQAHKKPQERQAEYLARSIANGNLDPGDRTYLAKLVAARTGMSQQDAEKRVDDVVAQMKAAADKAKQAADAARKATAKASFYLFFSMLIGAFIASVAGAIGGRQRNSFVFLTAEQGGSPTMVRLVRRVARRAAQTPIDVTLTRRRLELSCPP